MPSNLFPEHPYLTERFNHTQSVIKTLRSQLHEAFSIPSVSVVAVGSIARGELSEASDLDFFLLHDGTPGMTDMGRLIRVLQHCQSPYTTRGRGDMEKFSQHAICSFDELCKQMGGKQDTYTALMRRMLLLLEGRALYGDDFFNHSQQRLLRHYVSAVEGDSRLTRYLLNDLVRYYRTLMANFEHQVSVLGKPWGVRNVKLRFSRKLLFLGGVLAIAQTSHLTWQDKIEHLLALLRLTPLQRLVAVGEGNPSTVRVLDQYQQFLLTLSSPDNRRELDQLERHNRQKSRLYRELRALGDSFSQELERWIRHQFPDHPIHHALLF